MECTIYYACRGKMRRIIDEFEDFKDEVGREVHHVILKSQADRDIS